MGNAPPAGSRPVRLYDRGSGRSLSRRSAHAALQPDARMAGAGADVPGMARRGLRRSRAGPGAAAGGILRACRAGGLAQVRRVLSRAGSRAGGWNRGRRLRGGPAVPGDVPPARDVRGAARVPAPVMAAAAPDGGLGQLPRRVLSGAGGAGRVRRRGTLAAEAGPRAVPFSSGRRGGLGAESERLPDCRDPAALSRKLPHLAAAGMAGAGAVASQRVQHPAGGRRRRAGVAAQAGSPGGLAAVRGFCGGGADGTAQHRPDRLVRAGGDLLLRPGVEEAAALCPAGGRRGHDRGNRRLRLVSAASGGLAVAFRRRRFPAGSPRYRSSVQHLGVRRIPDVAPVAAGEGICRRPRAERIGFPGLCAHPLQPRCRRRETGCAATAGPLRRTDHRDQRIRIREWLDLSAGPRPGRSTADRVEAGLRRFRRGGFHAPAAAGRGSTARHCACWTTWSSNATRTSPASRSIRDARAPWARYFRRSAISSGRGAGWAATSN